ncbi:unnamed protein product, partial [Musa hybrid cultivar]
VCPFSRCRFLPLFYELSRRCLVLHNLNKSAPGIGVTRVSKSGWEG